MIRLIALVLLFSLILVPSSATAPKAEHTILLPAIYRQVCPGEYDSTSIGTFSRWHPLKIDLVGPPSFETGENPNPWLDVSGHVVFRSPIGETFDVPAYYAGDGNGGANGNVWRVNFAPDTIGAWTYCVFMRTGNDVNVSSDMTNSSTLAGNGDGGTFLVAENQAAQGLMVRGRPGYIGSHYLRYADGGYYLKAGTNSPENFMGYAGFDNTIDQGGIVSNFTHHYPNHVQDWNAGDPLFVSSTTGYDSKGIIGAINYLAEKGVKTFYWIPMNLGGDGQETYPFYTPSGTAWGDTHYDVSKLHQWLIVAEHAQRMGVGMHIILGETEFGNSQWLDNGALGVERKLYYKTMMALFGHLNVIIWNISEENPFTIERTIEFAEYLAEHNWSGHPITFHTHYNDTAAYVAVLNEEWMTATSIQYHPNNADAFVEMWRYESAANGRPWVVYLDEQGPAGEGLTDTNWEEHRTNILWPALLSGGAGIEWYAGYHPLPLGGDMRLEDFRTREAAWIGTRYAMDFMERIPFWDMAPADSLVTGEAQLLQGAGSYAVYLPNGGNEVLTLPNGSYSYQWFNPRTGVLGAIQYTQVVGGTLQLNAQDDNDWAAIVRRE